MEEVEAFKATLQRKTEGKGKEGGKEAESPVSDGATKKGKGRGKAEKGGKGGKTGGSVPFFQMWQFATQFQKIQVM